MTQADLTIDMDKRCISCGYKGATDNGKCLKCITTEIEGFQAIKIGEKKSSPDGVWMVVDNTVIDIAQELIRKYHISLREARIGFLFRNKGSLSGGKRVWGKASKTPSKYRVYLDYDFLIWIDHEIWASLTEQRRFALIDHELCHCDYTDEEASIRSHDIEEFNCIVERYGVWNHELMMMQSVIHPSPQLKMDLNDEPKGVVEAVDPEKLPK